MSIKISVQASGLSLSANLKDDGLTAILKLIQEMRDDSAPVVLARTGSPVVDHVGSTETTSENDSETTTKALLNERGGAELLNQLKWDSYPEKILLLGAWHEARGEATPWRSADMEDTFRLAKEAPPSNFPRDIKNAIRSGWIHNATPRRYIVTRTGWNKIGQALDNANS